MRRIIQTIRQILMIPALLSIYLALASSNTVKGDEGGNEEIHRTRHHPMA